MTASVCPCCGAPVNPTDLIVDLNTNTATRLGASVKMPPAETEILHALNASGLRVMRPTDLIAAVYGAHEPESGARSIAVRLCTVRRLVAPLGVSIKNVWGTGWRLSFHPEALPAHPRGTPKKRRLRRLKVVGGRAA